MRVCFPVFQNQGTNSLVHDYFDSAPLSLVIDVETRAVVAVLACGRPDRHDVCRSLEAFVQHSVEAIVADGIGAGTAAGFRQAGLKIFQAHHGTIADNLERMARGELPELSLDRCSAATTVPVYLNTDDDDPPTQFGCGF
jgi:predicted Fe-Mo cluster-binding NifX family protein